MSRTHGNNESPLFAKTLPFTGAAGSSGVFASIPNPFGADAIIHSAHVERTTKSTGASTIDAGIAADGTTSDDSLFDGLDSGAAEGIGASTTVPINWAADEFLNVAEATGNVDGLVGALVVVCSLKTF